MEIRSVYALRGPNIWGRQTVLEVVVDLRPLLEITSQQLTQLQDRISEFLPAVKMPGADDDGEVPLKASLAAVLLRTMLALQPKSDADIPFGRMKESAQPGVYELVVQYSEEQVGRMAAQVGFDLCQAVLSERPFDLTSRLAEIHAIEQRVRLTPSTDAIVQAAVRRGIPIRRLGEDRLVQLGHGCKLHRILAAETDRTGAVAESIAHDKELTRTMLRAVGVPVPSGRTVASGADAWAAAGEIGMPVVIKPKRGHQGRGVAVNLNSREQVLAAFTAASEEGEMVICEKFVSGHDFHLLIINDRLVAAARCDPPKVVGNGRQTIRELVEEINRNSNRADSHGTSSNKLRLDEIANNVLAEQGLMANSVPAVGQVVLIRRNGDLSTGGSATDVTELVHPEVAARAIDGVRMIGLNIAGVDVIATDISQPLDQQGGVVIEINATPDLRMYLKPSSGKAHRVGEAVIDMIFGPGENGRIPIVAVTGTNGKTTTTRLIAYILRSTNRLVGMTCTDGIFLNDRRIDTGDCSGPRSARNVLSNPVVEAAVFETARGGMLREGLGFDRADVSVVTNIGEGDHLGLNGIDTVEQLARVKRVVVENVHAEGYAVLNAADPMTVAMAEYCPGKIVFFARSPDQRALVAHRANGGKVIFVKNNCLTVAEGTWEGQIVSLESVPLTFGGQIGFQVENVLAAAGTAWALGVPIEVIRQALETFVSNFEKAPARFNVVQFRGATVVLDYGHNSSALVALLEAFEQMPHQRRLINYTATGDRRDQDIIRQAELIGNGFDEIVVFEDKCTRGRADGEVCKLLRIGLARGRRISRIRETRGEVPAIEMILNDLRPGDLALIQIDRVDEVLPIVNRFLGLLT